MGHRVLPQVPGPFCFTSSFTENSGCQGKCKDLTLSNHISILL